MSTIIKKGEQGKLLRKLVSLDLADHLAAADQVVAAARRQAQRIGAQAKTESARLHQDARRLGHHEGREAGYAEGLAEGRAQGLAEAAERFNAQHASLAASMAAVIDDLEGRKRDLMIEANRDLLEFAVTVAQVVTRRIGEFDRGAARANVEQALRLVGERTKLTVRINPADAETLRCFAKEVADEASNKQHLTIIDDDSVEPGGAVVTSGDMEIDARLETQLDQIATLLLGSEK